MTIDEYLVRLMRLLTVSPATRQRRALVGLSPMWSG